jgi:hypothetical protein
MRPGTVATGVALGGLVLAGCGRLAATRQIRDDTEAALERAGFESAGVDVPTADDSTLTVELDDGGTGEGAAAQAAEVVWDNAPVELEAVEVTIGDGAPSTFTDDELESRFGTRPAMLEVRAAPSGRGLPRGVGVAVMVLAVGITLILVRRRRSNHGARRSGR